MNRLPSEEVILAAPMSYTGSTQRLLKLTRSDAQGWHHALLVSGVVILLGLAWLAITCWYLTWGLFLIPYRLIRRGDRKRERDELRHREILAAANASAAPAAALPRVTESLTDRDDR